MDPIFPLGPENKQTFWQKILALPLAIKIGAVFVVVLTIGVVVVLLWRASPVSQLPTDGNTPQTQQSPTVAEESDNTSTNPDGTPKTEEEKKKEEEAKKNPTPQPQNPSTGGGTGGGTTSPNPGGGGTTTPPPVTPPPSSSRPSASNTGPTGTLTSTYGGAASNGSSNQTFENMNFPTPGAPGYYIFSGNNLTLRNCHIHGDGVLFSGDNITIENCIIEGGVSLSGTNGVTFRYNEVLNFSGDGIHLTSDSGQAANVTISHNYVHNPTPLCGDHSDGIQIRGVNTLTLSNNNFDMGPWFQVCGLDALNAAIFFESANGGNSNLTVDSNYLNGAGITLRLNPGSNQKIINNRFGQDYKYSVVSNQTSAGNITQQSGNVMDSNGSAVNF